MPQVIRLPAEKGMVLPVRLCFKRPGSKAPDRKAKPRGNVLYIRGSRRRTDWRQT
jgi:hypothetical protein